MLWDLLSGNAVTKQDIWTGDQAGDQLKKSDVVSVLVKWVCLLVLFASKVLTFCQRFTMPLHSVEIKKAHPTTTKTLEYIRQVIKESSKPSWLNHVPEAFGDAGTGKLKADEWQNLSSVYLPVALVLLWGKGSKQRHKDLDGQFELLLDNTMKLVQAVTLACYRSTTSYRINKTEEYLQSYLTQHQTLFPDVDPLTNQHMSLHLGKFLRLFGPVHSWWTFPFERLIGQLQQLPSNNKIGKQEQVTLHEDLGLIRSIGNDFVRVFSQGCLSSAVVAAKR